MNNLKNTNNEIDESLYSRQLYVLGHEAMKSMSQSNVLICGLNGLGVEVAKNLILSGVNKVSLQDTKQATNRDLASQFYLTVDDLGKNRAESVYSKLSELNMYVEIDVLTIPINEELIKEYSVVITCDSNLDNQIQVNNWCRGNNIKFINCSTKGLFGQIFCDFGDNFLVKDIDGETPLTSIIISIDSEGRIECSDTTPHGLTNSDQIEISEVEGIENVNGNKYEIKVVSPTCIQLLDFTPQGNYTSGGIIKQIKIPQTIKFKSLQESITSPEFVITDFANFSRPMTSHVAFQTLDIFRKKYSMDPMPGNKEDSNRFFDIAKAINPDVEEKIIKTFSAICQGETCPMQSVIGSIASQEVIKACSYKYSPINQWLYFDALDCLSEDSTLGDFPLPSENDNRYMYQTMIFGKEFQEKLMDQKWFVVGAGAIGCELLKNFAMIGLGCKSGKVTLTDMDTIERSNLNRQFLFRNSDIGKAKSTCAATAIKAMNPDFNIEAQLNKVCQENETFYDMNFYQKLDGVANALDNIPARLYVDRQCVLNGKPLLESGTLGTKGNTQVVIPNITESYGSTQDPPEKTIPVCTIKNFPNSIEHTIQWAREEFEGLFSQAPDHAGMFLKDNNFMKKISPSDKNGVIRSVMDLLVKYQPKTYTDCLLWAFKHWHKKYRDDIVNMLNKFPKDFLTSSGLPFWSGGKRCPTPIDFNSDNDLHINYIIACANLRSGIFSMQHLEDRTEIIKIIKGFDIPKLDYNKDYQVSVTDEEEKNKVEDELDESCLPDRTQFNIELLSHKFEKDDDSNFHIEFITCASNMRACNYEIPIATNHKTKGIAGKIIPAIATTTSLVAGLVSLELLKIVQGHKKIEKYNSGFVNLALPYFGFADPIEASKYKFNDQEYNLWNYIEVRENITLEKFIEYFEQNYKINVSTIMYGVTLLYAFFLPNTNKSKLLRDIIKEKNSDAKDLVVLTILADDDDIEVPQVKFYLDNTQEYIESV